MFAAQCRNLVGARDDSRQPRLVSQPGEAQHLVAGRGGDTLAGEFRLVEAREHGHAEQAGRAHALARGFLVCRPARRPHHGEPAGGVDGEVVRLQRDHAAHGACDGVRDVVELEVEEEGWTVGANRTYALRSMRAEILEAELEPAHSRRQQVRQTLHRGPVARIQGAVERDVRHGNSVRAGIVYPCGQRGTTGERRSGERR